MSDTKPLIIKADLFWCCNYVRNRESKKYQVDLCNLSEKAVAALQAEGIEVKSDPVKKPQQGYYVTVKSRDYCINTYDSDGKALGQTVRNDDGSTEVKKDESGAPMYTKVGNGSKALVTVTPYKVMFKGKPLIQASASKVVVTDLIVYEGGNSGTNVQEMEEEAL
jgi:hypothetical protein